LSDFLELKSISSSLNLIPSPVKVSAIPCKEARVRSWVKAGTFETLKFEIFKFEFDTSSL